jgi:hypothetical protein
MSVELKPREVKWSGWKQSNGPQAQLKVGESAYWGKAGTELLASASLESSGKTLPAEPLSVIIVQTDDRTLYYEFFQMTHLASSGMRFRAKTPDGWRSKFVEGTAWEALLKSAPKSD